MNKTEAFKVVGKWICDETEKRRYGTVVVKELSEALITLRQCVENEELEQLAEIGKATKKAFAYGDISAEYNVLILGQEPRRHNFSIRSIEELLKWAESEGNNYDD